MSDKDKELGKDIMALEQKITLKLKALHAKLKSEQKQMKEQKRVNKHYQDPFDIEPNDGYFLDKRQ